MTRHPRPWFRKSRRVWYVEIDGRSPQQRWPQSVLDAGSSLQWSVGRTRAIPKPRLPQELSSWGTNDFGLGESSHAPCAVRSRFPLGGVSANTAEPRDIR